MLVEYTPLSALDERELNALKTVVRGMTLESSRTCFAFAGKVFNMREIISAKQMWESQTKTPAGQLNG